MRPNTPGLPLLAALVLLPLSLAGCSETAPVIPPGALDCSPPAQWRAGQNGDAAQAACSEAEAREAQVLGSELHALRSEYEQIAEALRLAPEADDVGARTRRQRQLQVDMEAIESEARVRGWSGANAGPGAG
ncbi:MAG: hypothetical protein MEQ07_01570 [Aquimonas sp.]|nr:hypothetical protein [Aquimonas sp.]